ncbi:hypothetical protein Tco_0139310 [Tanacetum coccineum]
MLPVTTSVNGQNKLLKIAKYRKPMPAADSPTHQSPGYIPESDPEEDPERMRGYPEEDPADYPADRGDRDDEDH